MPNVRLDVPYDKQETENSCWYASLSMMLGYHNVGIPNLTHTKAYTEGLMWDKGELDWLMEKCNLGIRLSKNDIGSDDKLANVLVQWGPMMALAKATNHVVVVIGIDLQGFVHFYDPGPKQGQSEEQIILLSKFIEACPCFLQYNRESETNL